MSLHIQESGRGDAVLLLHGTPSPAAHFKALVEELTRTYRVLVPDLPGYGASTRLTSFSLSAVQLLIEDALSRLDIDRVALVGFSSGAYHALSLALRREISITSIVTLGGFATLPPDRREGLRALAQQLREQPGAIHDPSIRGLMGQLMLSPDFAAAHPETVAEVTGWWDIAPPAVLAEEFGSFAQCADLCDGLRDLRVPILALVGELDSSTGVARSEEICQAAPRARIEVAQGAGHALLYEAPRWTVDAVLRGIAATP